MSVDADVKGRRPGYVFKFDKLNSSVNRDFEVQTPEGPLALTLELYPREGIMYCKISIKQERYATWEDMIYIDLCYKLDGKIEDKKDWFHPAQGDHPFLIEDEIKLSENQSYQHIIIRCRVYFGLNKNKEVIYKYEKGVCSRGLDHEELITSDKFADFTICADGQQFKCHKNILASRSTFFERMLTTEMKENTENEGRVACVLQ